MNTISPIREITSDDREAISEVATALNSAEHSAILALRSKYAPAVLTSFRHARKYITEALEKLDAAEALLDPATKTEAVPLRSAEELASIQAQAHAALDAAATAEAVADGGGI